jgi:protein Mpv17
VRTKLKPTLLANYMVWPAAHLINFSLVPLDLRILYVNVIAIFWTVYLSSMASKNA